MKMKTKTTRSLLSLVSLSLVLAVLLSACGGDVFSTNASQSLPGSNNSAPGATGGNSKVPARNLTGCSLITKDDVKPFIGGDITQEENRGECTYLSAGLPPTVLLFSIDNGDAQDYAIQKKIYSGLGGAFASADSGPFAGAGEVVGISATPQDVPGLGDQAFWTGGFLIILKGDKLMTLTFLSGSGVGKPKFDILKGLAQTAISRL
jgi:hypothetical protein